MQDEPGAAALLEAVADTLETRILDGTDPSLRHQVRVAANLCRIVAREVTLDPAADQRARAALGALLGAEGPPTEQWAELATRLTPDPAGDPDPATEALAAAAHPVVLAIVRDKLAVAKPGYDAYPAGTDPTDAGTTDPHPPDAHPDDATGPGR